LQVITSQAIPMPLPGEKYWPYPVLPEAELTERSRREIRFLERAYQDGLRPSTHAFGFTLRSLSEDREADIIRRMYSQDWWELVLFANRPTQMRVMSGFVTGFEWVTSLARQWGQGTSTAEMWAELSPVGTRLRLEGADA
jgi:hypothetical protein